MLQVTQAPQGPVLVQRRFSILGIASTIYAGRPLVLTVDESYTTNGPAIKSNGTWQVDFLFQQIGNRRLQIAVGTDSTEIIIPVVASSPEARRLRFTQVPTRLPAGQLAVIGGTADNYADGTALLLQADGQFELACPLVRLGRWQATIGFDQEGKHILKIISSEDKVRAKTEIEVVAAPSQPPRLSFTDPPQQTRVEETLLLTGAAEHYNDGDQLVLRVDQKVELARPLVKHGRWQAQTLFRQTGNRLVEILGSEQDKVQVVIQVLEVDPGMFRVLPRSTWTNTPTPSSLPDLQPQGITIHHTFLSSAPSPDATIADEAARMRVIWNGHVNGNGWSDIGYHFIIMPSGRVYTARSEAKRGSHDTVNDGLGIAFDGIYSSTPINSQMYNSAVALCTLLCKRYGITDTITPIPTPTADFGIRNLPRLMGHCDRVATECPGSEGGRTVRLPEMRQAVNSQI